MKGARNLLCRCRALGLKLRVRGDLLEVRPADRVTPEVLAELRTQKSGLMLLLEAEAAQLTPDCARWLHVARQVLAGEFDGGDRSLLGSLLMGLRNIPHPQCQQARARLENFLGHNGKEARR